MENRENAKSYCPLGLDTDLYLDIYASKRGVVKRISKWGRGIPVDSLPFTYIYIYIYLKGRKYP